MTPIPTSRKLRIAVLFGGRSGEHEVSLMSARSVLSVLDPQKYDVIQIGITREGHSVSGADVLHALETNHPDGLQRIFFPPEPGASNLYEYHSIQNRAELHVLPDVDVY